jgi:P-type Ca2+ transporter type 2C
LIMAAVELPFLTRVFSVSELHLDQWLTVLGMGVLMIVIVEIVKFFERKADQRNN